VVDAASGDSDNPTRDHKMHAEVLESQRYPEIVFVPLQVRGQVVPEGVSTVEVDGTLTLHGASHPLTVTAVVRTTGEHFTISSSFRVPYVQWGMRDPSTFILPVGKQAKILLEVAGRVRR
jgi:polyisoprenoid-binding protein YceI